MRRAIPVDVSRCAHEAGLEIPPYEPRKPLSIMGWIHVIHEGEQSRPGLNLKLIIKNSDYRVSGRGRGFVLIWHGPYSWRFRFRRGIAPHFMLSRYKPCL